MESKKLRVATTLLMILSVTAVSGLAVSSILVSRSHPLRQMVAEEQGKTQATGPKAQEQRQDRSIPWPWGDSPVAYGKRVPLAVATTFLRACLCPLLPESGPASPEHVDNSWANQDGVVVLEFDSGITLAASPDPTIRADQWVANAEAGIAEDGWGRIVALRDTQAVGQNRDEAYEGMVPSLTWVEGNALITVASHGPQNVAELVLFSESLPYAQTPE